MQNGVLSSSGSSSALFFKAFIVLICIILLFYGFMLLLKFLQNRFVIKRPAQARLAIQEQLIIDNARKLIVINFDEKEYLLFLGVRNEFLIPPPLPPCSEAAPEFLSNGSKDKSFSALLNEDQLSQKEIGSNDKENAPDNHKL